MALLQDWYFNKRTLKKTRLPTTPIPLILVKHYAPTNVLKFKLASLRTSPNRIIYDGTGQLSRWSIKALQLIPHKLNHCFAASFYTEFHFFSLISFLFFCVLSKLIANWIEILKIIIERLFTIRFCVLFWDYVWLCTFLLERERTGI